MAQPPRRRRGWHYTLRQGEYQEKYSASWQGNYKNDSRKKMLPAEPIHETITHMNDTICERCGEDEAVAVIEHVLYAEAVCGPCREDEYKAGERDAHLWDMKVIRDENALDS